MKTSFNAGWLWWLALMLGMGWTSAGCHGSQQVGPVTGRPAPRAADSPRQLATLPCTRSEFFNWCRTVHGAAKGDPGRIAEWWESAAVDTTGVLPFVFATEGVQYGSGTGERRITVAGDHETVQFRLGDYLSPAFHTLRPQPATMKSGSQDLPVMGRASLFESASQAHATLAGIAYAYTLFDDSASIQPRAIREQFRWVVPPATVAALEPIGPFEIRKGEDGSVAVICALDGARAACIAYRRSFGQGRRMGGMITLRLGEQHPLIKSDPASWPLLADSLEDL